MSGNYARVLATSCLCATPRWGRVGHECVRLGTDGLNGPKRILHDLRMLFRVPCPISGASDEHSRAGSGQLEATPSTQLHCPAACESTMEESESHAFVGALPLPRFCLNCDRLTASRSPAGHWCLCQFLSVAVVRRV